MFKLVPNESKIQEYGKAKLINDKAIWGLRFYVKLAIERGWDSFGIRMNCFKPEYRGFADFEVKVLTRAFCDYVEVV